MRFDSIPQLLQEFRDGAPPQVRVIDYQTFDEFYNAYHACIDKHFTDLHNNLDDAHNHGNAAPFLSIFVEDCIERGRGYYRRGPEYCVSALHAGGLPDAANSLLVIKKMIYEDKFMTLNEFTGILKNNWEGNEALRRMVMNRFDFYGNDKDEADEMLVKLYNDYTGVVGTVKERNGVKRPAGISTFARELEWLPDRKASPCGAKQDAVLARQQAEKKLFGDFFRAGINNP